MALVSSLASTTSCCCKQQGRIGKSVESYLGRVATVFDRWVVWKDGRNITEMYWRQRRQQFSILVNIQAAFQAVYASVRVLSSDGNNSPSNRYYRWHTSCDSRNIPNSHPPQKVVSIIYQSHSSSVLQRITSSRNELYGIAHLRCTMRGGEIVRVVLHLVS